MAPGPRGDDARQARGSSTGPTRQAVRVTSVLLNRLRPVSRVVHLVKRWYPGAPPHNPPRLLRISPNFDKSNVDSIAFEPLVLTDAEADENDRCVNCSESKIVRRQPHWVSGSLFVAWRRSMLTFTTDFPVDMESMLTMKLMGSDKQILRAIFDEKLTTVEPTFSNNLV